MKITHGHHGTAALRSTGRSSQPDRDRRPPSRPRPSTALPPRSRRPRRCRTRPCSPSVDGADGVAGRHEQRRSPHEGERPGRSAGSGGVRRAGRPRGSSAATENALGSRLRLTASEPLRCTATATAEARQPEQRGPRSAAPCRVERAVSHRAHCRSDADGRVASVWRTENGGRLSAPGAARGVARGPTRRHARSRTRVSGLGTHWRNAMSPVTRLVRDLPVHHASPSSPACSAGASSSPPLSGSARTPTTCRWARCSRRSSSPPCQGREEPARLGPPAAPWGAVTEVVRPGRAHPARRARGRHPREPPASAHRCRPWPSSATGPTLPATFVVMLVMVGIGEEAGWTAFAAPLLLRRHGILRRLGAALGPCASCGTCR